jgi:hypothetical protein
MEIRVTARQGKPPKVQVVKGGRLSDLKFVQTAPWVVFKEVTCERADFSRIKFAPFAVDSGAFIGCDFSRAVFLHHSSFGAVNPKERQTVFRDCRFDRADMRSLRNFGNARFELCSFRDTRIEGWRADRAEFIDCVFSGRMYDCRFAGRPWLKPDVTNRKRNEFHGNDFRDVDLAAVQFAYGIDLDAQMLPDGENYVRLSRPRERVDRVRALISQWPDDAARESALGKLSIVSSPGDLEQDVLFLDRRLYSDSRVPGVGKRVLDMLEHALD